MKTETPKAKAHRQIKNVRMYLGALIRLTKKAEPPPTCDVNRDSGTRSTVAASANGG